MGWVLNAPLEMILYFFINRIIFNSRVLYKNYENINNNSNVQ